MGIKKNVLLFVFVHIFTACSMIGSDGLGKYMTETITVEDPGFQTKLLNYTQYSIDSVCSLSMPQNIKEFCISKFIAKNNRVYLMDDSYTHTILAFDSNGNFLYKAGDRGRARNEYIDGPSDFFVDNKNNLHVFDYRGQKIIVFDSEGKFMRTINTWEEHPWSIGLTENGQYLYSFMENTSEAALAICNNDNKIQKKLIPFGKEYTYLPSRGCFFQNGNRLSHIPILSDSILVFNKDILEKIVRVDFKGKFIMDAIPDVVTDAGKTDELATFNGIKNIQQYQETDSLIYLRYLYRNLERTLLIKKKSKEMLGGLSLFDGISPFSNYYLLDNKLVTFVSDEIVDLIKDNPRNDSFVEAYNKSAPNIQAIIDGKIKTPAILYISLK